MIRYGRSDSLIPMARYGRSDTLIPMARYGRSDSLIPMARYGRSDTLIPMARYGRSETLIPMARYGRSDSLIPIPRFGKSSEHSENLDLNSDGIAIEENSEEEYNLESLKSSKKRNDENGAIIPYPRPGRELQTAEKKEDDLKSSDSEVRRQTNESLIPQIRYGRTSGKAKTPENEQSHIFILPNIRPGRSSQTIVANKGKEGTKSAQYGLLPYPRPGRSDINQNGMEKQFNDLNENLDSTFDIKRSEEGSDDQIVLESVLEDDIILDPGYIKSYKEQNLINADEDNSRFVIPYPRPGKRDLTQEETPVKVLSGDSKNYPYLFKISKENDESVDYSSSYSNAKKLSNEGKLESPKEKKMALKREVSFDYLSVPHLRFQRSIISDKPEFLLPYPRPGRSNTILPFPRPGRSNTILPFPRPGRSNTILPFPRPGRSNTILPLPRPGRSNTILPLPRPGRSNSVLPYPRPGRSDSIVPFPRPGRSNTVVPFPRPGRSEVILPYPRPGRSGAILPYPRPGRSTRDKVLKRNVNEYLMPHSQAENSMNEESSEVLGTFLQEDDSGRESFKLKDVPSLVKKLNEEISTSNSIYLLPYPRPGRTVKRNFA
ncbi:Melanoma-associated antigen E1 like protein [Argiope bruennichi]|nr:Melanoma-associated antigen E1 like protein [Argiope bruennichi]